MYRKKKIRSLYKHIDVEQSIILIKSNSKRISVEKKRKNTSHTNLFQYKSVYASSFDNLSLKAIYRFYRYRYLVFSRNLAMNNFNQSFSSRNYCLIIITQLFPRCKTLCKTLRTIHRIINSNVCPNRRTFQNHIY